MILDWVVQATLVAGAGTLVLSIALTLWRPRPAVQHALWCVLLLKLLLPPIAVLPIIPVALLGGSLVAGASAPGEAVMSAARAVGPAGQLRAAESKERGLAPAVSTLLAIWAIGSMFAFATLCKRQRVARRGLARAEPPPAGLRRTVARVAADLCVPMPELIGVRGSGIPFLIGLRRPVLGWPIELAALVDTPTGLAVVAHELAHLRRRDVASSLVAEVARAIWWWNPIGHIVAGRLHRTSEMACDDWAVRVAPEARQEYAATLTRLAMNGKASPAGALSLARGGARRRAFQTLRVRLRALQPDRRYQWPRLDTGVALLAAAALAVPVVAGPLRAENEVFPLLGAAGLGDFSIGVDGTISVADEGWMEVFALDIDGTLRHARLVGDGQSTLLEAVTDGADLEWVADTLRRSGAPDQLVDERVMWTFARVPRDSQHFNRVSPEGAVALWTVGLPRRSRNVVESGDGTKRFAFLALRFTSASGTVQIARGRAVPGQVLALKEWRDIGGWTEVLGSRPAWLDPVIATIPGD